MNGNQGITCGNNVLFYQVGGTDITDLITASNNVI